MKTKLLVLQAYFRKTYVIRGPPYERKVNHRLHRFTRIVKEKKVRGTVGTGVVNVFLTLLWEGDF